MLEKFRTRYEERSIKEQAENPTEGEASRVAESSKDRASTTDSQATMSPQAASSWINRLKWQSVEDTRKSAKDRFLARLSGDDFSDAGDAYNLPEEENAIFTVSNNEQNVSEKNGTEGKPLSFAEAKLQYKNHETAGYFSTPPIFLTHRKEKITPFTVSLAKQHDER